MANFCMYCGKPVQEDADFCMYCGKPLPKIQAAPAQQTPAATPQTSSSRQAPVNVTELTPEKRNEIQAPSMKQGDSIIAGKQAGEILIGELEMNDSASAAVKGPVGGIIRSIGSYLGGIVSIFRNKFTLIGTVLATALWGTLWYFQDSDSQIIKILSFLTFSEGGFERAIPGMIGGALGKGTVAAAIVSLFNGGIKGLFKGIGVLFTGHGEKRNIPGIVLGAAAGAALYLFFCGTRASLCNIMPALSSAVLSLEAMGSGRGKLFELVSSVTSRKTDGIRTAVTGRSDSILTGMILGIAVTCTIASMHLMEVII